MESAYIVAESLLSRLLWFHIRLQDPILRNQMKVTPVLHIIRNYVYLVPLHQASDSKALSVCMDTTGAE